MPANVSRGVFGAAIIGFIMLGMLLPRLAIAADVQEQIFKTISGEQLRSMMADEGYAATIDEDGDLVWKINGFKAQLIIGEGQEAVQFHIAFRDVDVTLAEVNEWNRTKRFSCSYLDDEGDPHLELDLDLAGGVTDARILDFLRTCRISFETWHTEIVR